MDHTLKFLFYMNLKLQFVFERNVNKLNREKIHKN